MNIDGTSRGKAKIDHAVETLCLIRFLAEFRDVQHAPSFLNESQWDVDTRYQRNPFEGLRLLMHCRWWNRVWVVQEVVVPQKVTMIYGSTVAPWEMFVNAAFSYSRHLTSPMLASLPPEYTKVLDFFCRIVLDLYRMRELWQKGEQTALLPLLRQFSGRGATDDRDKVYALLGLAKDESSISPDYSLDVPEVFQNVALNVMEATRSLDVLIGDLGRKNRQDLPSWVPDWSAAYDDLDRRRADNTGNYHATCASSIYVQHRLISGWDGVRQYIERLRVEKNLDQTSIGWPRNMRGYYNAILGTSDWSKGLHDDGGVTDDVRYLEAIEEYLIVRGGPVCVQDHGLGVIGMPGLHVDKVTVIGEVSFSLGELSSIIQSWAILATTHCRRYRSTKNGAGEAFWRTLCADTIPIDDRTENWRHRRISVDDKNVIATWLLHAKDSPLGPKNAYEPPSVEAYDQLIDAFVPRYGVDPIPAVRDILFQDQGSVDSVIQPELIASYNAAVRLATTRRRFFITESGYFGLGPAKMRVGDHLYVLLGGHTAFVLRYAGSRSILRRWRLDKLEVPCFELLGDCYAHGIMDGEAMHDWTRAAAGRVQNAKDTERKWKDCVRVYLV